MSRSSSGGLLCRSKSVFGSDQNMVVSVEVRESGTSSSGWLGLMASPVLSTYLCPH